MKPFKLFKTDQKRIASLEQIKATLEKFWSLESISVEDCHDSASPFTFAELEAIRLVQEGSVYEETECRWYVSIPWKDCPSLGDNYGASFQVMKSVENSVKRKKFEKIVNEAYADFVNQGYAKQLPFDELRKSLDKPCSYIPSFAVYTPEKDSTKVRIVMNASAKSSTGESLNSSIYQGPCYIPDLTVTLIKFRAGKHAFVFDVKQMFMQVKLRNASDKHFFRYLWRNCETDKPPIEFEMGRLIFGLNCSPFIASWCVKQTAFLFAKQFPLGAELALNDTYVDDIIVSLGSTKECQTAISELQKLFAKASMQLHKFNSSNLELKKQLEESQISQKKTTKILGQKWNIETDQLCFNFTDSTGLKDMSDCTKRRFLSEVGKIFDPLGLISVILFPIKIMFQQLWQLDIGWDDNMPCDLNTKWRKFKEQLPLLHNFVLPRSLVVDKVVQDHSLLIFCDASNLGYACCSYLFTKYQDGSVQACFIMSKTRIKPIKPLSDDENISIVRLELLGMLIGVRLANHIKTALATKLVLKQTVFFTDSSINYFRLRKGFASLKQWAGNRVAEILTHSKAKDWIHIPTDLNIADFPSRGMDDINDFLKLKAWLHGPAFLYEGKSWDTYSKINSMKQRPQDLPDLELKPKVAVKLTKVPPKNPVLQILETRFSSWHKTLKLAAFIFRLASKSHWQYRKKSLTIAELRQTELLILSHLQQEVFRLEFESLTNQTALNEGSPLLRFNPFLENGVLKSNSRLALSTTLRRDEKFPIILPSHHPLVEKLILSIHISNCHLNLKHLLVKVRSQYLVLGGRREITRILNSCPNRNCRKVIPLSQLMGPLPSERLDGTNPFEHVGLDYAGPIYYSGFANELKVAKKAWIAIFTCFTSRAVHLELVLDSGTEECLNALRLFISRRGLPKSIFSDNASIFKLASKEIKHFLSKINWTKINDFCLSKGFDWTYSLPNTPHLNGVTERMVKSVKGPLRKVLGQTTLTFRQLTIVLAEIEQILNSRPLSVPSTLLESPITPFQLMFGRPFEPLPTQKNTQGFTFPDLWLKRKNILQAFWKTFSHEYLLSLGVRKKWQQIVSTDLMRKIVLLNDPNVPIFKWKLGLVTQCYQSRDGQIRTVQVKLPTGSVTRSVNTLSLFEDNF